VKDRNLGNKYSCSRMLVISRKGVVKLCSSKDLAINFKFRYIGFLVALCSEAAPHNSSSYHIIHQQILSNKYVSSC